MAYPLAALVTGWLATRGFDRRYLTSVLAMLAGLAVDLRRRRHLAPLFAPGADGRSLHAALATGFYPFVVADRDQVCLAAAVMPVAVAVSSHE